MNVSFRKRVLLDFIARHSGLMLLVAFGLAGLWVLDDYGVGRDAGIQRYLAAATFDYLFGDDDAIPKDSDKFYGMAFELPLLLTELALGLDDTRDVYLTRHLITHLFFLAGGFFCYLLTYRLFESRPLAALALLLFLLHPRLYAHSFFNTKDIPFLSMFMICLYLTHRAFEKGNVWRFVALGIGAGLLINLRIMGATLFVVVLSMQLLGLLQADDNSDRKRALSSTAVFMLSSLLTVYVSTPYLWSDPIGMSMEWFYTFSQHPTNVYQLFRGEQFWTGDVHPPEYIPVWMSITTAPLALALGIAGMLVVFMRGACSIRDAFRNARLRFGFLLVGCFILPIVAVIVLSPNVYNGWRQMYFLYAPFCILAVFGIHWLVSSARGRRVRFAGYGAVGAGLAAVAASITTVHPNQNLYFNFMVDRTTPEHLRTHYQMDYWFTSFRYGLEHLLEQYPFSSVYVEAKLGTPLEMNRRILPAADRHRLFPRDDDGDFWLNADQNIESDRTDIYSLKVYGNTIFTIRDLSVSNGVKVDDVLREAYLASKSDKPMISSDWDVYLGDGALVYVREPCMFVDVAARFFLHLHPADMSDLPEGRRELGFDNLDFSFYRSGGVFDGICLARIELPDYDIARISTGQLTSEGRVWSREYNMAAADAVAAARDFLEKDVHPAVRSVFDVYIHDGRLIYAKDVCDPDDREARFFLHVHPADMSDLPEERRESGYDNLDFNLRERGGESDGACFAVVELPGYEIARISTGQYTSESLVWGGEYNMAAADAATAARDFLEKDVHPAVRSVFDVYIHDGRLIYAKDVCAPDDREARFFLHVHPADVSDLPEERRESGYDNLDFNLRERGGESDGACFAVVELPDYDIARIYTGQYTSEGLVWGGEYNMAAADAVAAARDFLEKDVQPAVRSVFDVYIHDGKLIYTKSPCTDADHDARFFLHVNPVDMSDLPEKRREYGFDNLDFNLWDHGGESDGDCFAAVVLPNYDIARIFTGQYTSDGGVWSEEFETKGK